MNGRRALFVPAMGANAADAQYLVIVEQAIDKIAEQGVVIDVAADDPTSFDPGVTTQMTASNLAARCQQKHKDV